MGRTPELVGRGQSLAIAFTTMGRPHIARRFVQAARRRFPTLPIHVADQSPPDREQAAFYAEHDVKTVPVGEDIGLSASRNRLVGAVDADFIWICDDDYIFYGETSHEEAMALFASCPDIAIVGPRVFDLSGDLVRKWHWEYFIHHDERNRFLSLLPIQHLRPALRRLGSIRYYLADTVHNCAIFRRSMFGPRIAWDDNIKINGEHEDFYLNIKRNSPLRVAYLPTMLVFHRPDSADSRLYRERRSRMEYWQYFREKWNIDQLFESGAGLWLIDDSYEHMSVPQVVERFHSETDDVVGRRIMPALPAGEARLPTEPGAIQEIVTQTGAADRNPDGWTVIGRYEVGGSIGNTLTLWLSALPAGDCEGRNALQLDIRARWFDGNDQVLVWETSRVPMRLPANGEWLPLWLDLPLCPAGCPHLRFEVFADLPNGKSSLCGGYIPGSPANIHVDCVALGPEIENSAVNITGQIEPVTLNAAEVGGRGASVMAFDLSGAGFADALVIQFDAGRGWRRLALAELRRRSDWPSFVLLPNQESGSPDVLAWLQDAEGSACTMGPATRKGGASPRTTSSRKSVAVVLTSCGRQDLLERTLDSFFAANTYGTTQFIIVEDGPAAANAALQRKHAHKNLTWLATERRAGQINAIDFAYAHVTSEYVFHMEDDWEFFRGGFIENSMRVLDAVPDCLQVWIRSHDDTNGHPISSTLESAAGIPYRRLAFNFRHRWHGFSLNPGLRRWRDYAMLGRFGWFTDSEGFLAEGCLSEIYRQLGYHAVILADEGGKGYVRHIGWDRTVIEDPLVTHQFHEMKPNES